MVDTEIIGTVVGIIGNVISFGLFVLAVPSLYRILKNKSVKGVRPEYRLAMIMSCVFWVFYGIPSIHPRHIHVTTAYGIGLAIELAYLILILLYADDNKQRMYVGCLFLIELVAISLVIGLVIRLSPTAEIRRKLVELFCLLSGVLVSGAEGLCMGDMIIAKSVEYVEHRIVLGKFLYAICWTIYALLRFDSDVVFLSLNIAGVLWGVLQLKLYDHVYYLSTAKSGADKKLLATAELLV
ncbi:Bidirectional sugar transporter SWEET [Heracleum sosnowskyi]|uniref:Bidirectional sugar transporter SWEET n=1 Tax=Heracleum sosnowskyi TaxID=360622 RepID=A0AAD8JLJ0_9APIA|nr:Bidirectional sugar transporter SWEET [Heracleum sosnowskyi]KAK1404774.1 Bidirectional sugar transporter SWEET [Heracleum sosnowskyi]KAK1404782.1 Bidirectional sugar transporter SWEET [Heracleum sosnowskyi]